MPLSVNDLITDAMQELGALAAGEPLLTPTGAMTPDAAKGLATYNRMIDAVQISKGNIFTERADLYTLVIGQQAYTIGIDPTGVAMATFPVVRPIRLSRVNVLLASGGSGPIYRKVSIRSAAQWGARQYRRTQAIPYEMYPDYAYPLSTWQFFPYPDQAYQIEVWSWQQFAQAGPIIGQGTVTTAGTGVTWVSGTTFTVAQAGAGIVIAGTTYLVSAFVDATHLTLASGAGAQTAVGYVTGGIATLIVIPPGYYEYWMYSLTIRLAAAFGRTLKDQTIELYKEAREAVMSLNCVSPRQRTDFDTGSRNQGLYNWLDGQVEPY